MGNSLRALIIVLITMGGAYIIGVYATRPTRIFMMFILGAIVGAAVGFLVED